MSEISSNYTSYLSRIKILVKNNLKNIIIFSSCCFLLFLFYQIFIFYTNNKITKNSIEFFNIQNINNDEIQESIIKLSKQNNFYGILSKLELIDLNFKNKNYDDALNIYDVLLKDKKINNVYKSAIASKASYDFIDLNFEEISKNFTENIKFFISFIDDDLENYQGVKLELNYLLKILDLEINNVQYLQSKEMITLYNNIQISDFTSPAIKERVKKIHEFFSYKK